MREKLVGLGLSKKKADAVLDLFIEEYGSFNDGCDCCAEEYLGRMLAREKEAK